MPVSNRTPYEQIFSDFKLANTGAKPLGIGQFSQTVKALLPVTKTNLSGDKPESLLFGSFLNWLDDDFKLAIDGKPLIGNINLLPLFDDFIATKGWKTYLNISDNEAQALGAKAKDIITQQYVDLEVEQMNATDFEASRLMSEEQRRAKALQTVESSPIFSPLYKIAVESSQTDPITNQPAQYGAQGSGVPGALESVGTGALEAETFEDFLRLNPNSSVYDLMSMEVVNAGDESFTEGFDSTMFSGWLTNKQKNEANATKEDGTSALWSPSEAIKFIYDLADQGNTKKINELQTMLRRAGYFTLLGEGGVLPIPGVVDTAMEQAWGLFLTDAARMNKTPADMFKQKTNQYAQMTRTGQGMIGKDEAGISQNIDALSFEILGRRLSPAEKQSLVAAVQGWEREQLSTQLYSDKPTTIDIDARLGQLIERENSEEVAFSVSSSMDAKFRKMYGD